MKIHHGIPERSELIRPVITTGTFDGVHAGHRKIIERLVAAARSENGHSVIVTFEPHPRLVLFPDDQDLRLLTTLTEKAALLENAGIDHLVVIPFTREFSRTTSEEYVRDILVRKMGLHRLVIGYDHHFGRNREGSIEQLQLLAPEFGFTVEEIPPQDVDQVRVSSTKIRTALLQGDVALAAQYLTYHYKFSGTVVHGNRLGTQLGFPTANIRLNDPLKLIPGNGVYAVKVQLQNINQPGLMNIGFRPTLNHSPDITLEVHLLDFNQNIYGEELTINFIARIRDEQRFPSADALKQQIRNDIDSAKVWLT